MKKSIVGILAHVDAGKTTLAESLLCACGVIEKAGRVDHGDAFLDNGDMERDMWISLRKVNGRCRYWMRRFWSSTEAMECKEMYIRCGGC